MDTPLLAGTVAVIRSCEGRMTPTYLRCVLCTRRDLQGEGKAQDAQNPGLSSGLSN